MGGIVKTSLFFSLLLEIKVVLFLYKENNFSNSYFELKKKTNFSGSDCAKKGIYK